MCWIGGVDGGWGGVREEKVVVGGGGVLQEERAAAVMSSTRSFLVSLERRIPFQFLGSQDAFLYPWLKLSSSPLSTAHVAGP